MTSGGVRFPIIKLPSIKATDCAYLHLQGKEDRCVLIRNKNGYTSTSTFKKSVREVVEKQEQVLKER